MDAYAYIYIYRYNTSSPKMVDCEEGIFTGIAKKENRSTI